MKGYSALQIVKIAFDTHVHVYPFYDERAVFAAVAAKARALDADVAGICLTERFDCHFFQALRARGNVPLRGECATITVDGRELLVFAGRQVVTKERIEVLALTTDADIPDGLAAREVLQRVRDAGGVSVLAWAPGKWLFNRGKLVASLIEEAKAGELVLGDSSLRPIGWGEPLLFKQGARKGLPVIAGSDPLPFAGEERQAGRYMTLWDESFDATNPVTEMRRLLGRCIGRRTGKRSSMPEVVTRLRQNARSKAT